VPQQTQTHPPNLTASSSSTAPKHQISASLHSKCGFRSVRARHHRISRIVLVDFYAKYDGWHYHSGMSWLTRFPSPSRWASSNIKSSVVISPRRVSPIPRYTACASSRPMRSLPSRDSGISCGAPDNMLLPRQGSPLLTRTL
jgi:hypothetical protein